MIALLTQLLYLTTLPLTPEDAGEGPSGTKLHMAEYLHKVVKYELMMQQDRNREKINFIVHTLFKKSINDVIVESNPFVVDFGSQTICQHVK